MAHYGLRRRTTAPPSSRMNNRRPDFYRRVIQEGSSRETTCGRISGNIGARHSLASCDAPAAAHIAKGLARRAHTRMNLSLEPVYDLAYAR